MAQEIEHKFLVKPGAWKAGERKRSWLVVLPTRDDAAERKRPWTRR